MGVGLVQQSRVLRVDLLSPERRTRLRVAEPRGRRRFLGRPGGPGLRGVPGRREGGACHVLVDPDRAGDHAGQRGRDGQRALGQPDPVAVHPVVAQLDPERALDLPCRSPDGHEQPVLRDRPGAEALPAKPGPGLGSRGPGRPEPGHPLRVGQVPVELRRTRGRYRPDERLRAGLVPHRQQQVETDRAAGRDGAVRVGAGRGRGQRSAQGHPRTLVRRGGGGRARDRRHRDGQPYRPGQGQVPDTFHQ